jgi:hypothetical protein
MLKRQRTSKQIASSAPISNLARPSVGKIAVFLFILLFGIGIGFPVFILPVSRIVRARRWPTVPCTIIASRMTSERGSKGGTYYRAKFQYRYSFNGRVYSSRRYSANDLTTTDKSSTAALVARYSAGSHTMCFVNPADPSDAMLNRDWDWSLAMVLVPLFFVVLGAGGLIFVVRARRGPRAGFVGGRGGFAVSLNAHPVMPMPLTDHRATGPVKLRASDNPVGRFVLALLLTVGVNTIVPLVLIAIWKSPGRIDICVTAFAIPFVAVGAVLIVWTFYQFVALFNPRPTLTIDRGAIALGESAHLKWSFSGRYDRIGRLRISLEGREEATYRRGTNTRTDHHVFYRVLLGDVTRPMDIAVGKAMMTIPAGTMHTLSAPNNAIVWSLKLHGEIDGRPDIKEEFPIVVPPA